MGERPLRLPGVAGGHGELDAAHADADLGADLEELEADGAAGGGGELGMGEADASERADQHIEAMEANHSLSWLARMVAAEVRSARRSSWHSLIRFSISPRAQ